MPNWRSPHDSLPVSTDKKRHALIGAIALSLAALALQTAGAWYSGSLALLGDTAHVLTDLLSLVMSLVAVIIAARPASKNRSFGFYRLEVLASFLNGFLLLIVSLGLAKEGLIRLWNPEPVKVIPMIVVATIGLLFNLASAWLLIRASVDHNHNHGHSHGTGCGHDHGNDHDHKHEHAHASVRMNVPPQASTSDHGQVPVDRNMQSALLHVWSDAMGSVAVILGGVAMEFTGYAWIDAVVGTALALWILRWAWHVILDAGHVLLESTPRHVNAEKVEASMRGLDQRIDGVDDLHVWELTSRMYAATAEVRVKNMDFREAEELRKNLHALLHENFGIAHVVLAIRPS